MLRRVSVIITLTKVITKLITVVSDDLNDVVVRNADCYSKGPGSESRVSHGPFQKVKHWIDNSSCKK
jgi:hypothetical protein